MANSGSQSDKTVRAVLKELGQEFEQYAELFEKDGIDMQSDLIVMDLNNADARTLFKSIQIGHRFKIKRKIRELQRKQNASSDDIPEGTATSSGGYNTGNVSIKVTVGKKLTVGPEAMCGIGILQTGAPKGNNKIFEDKNLGTIDIQLTAKEADIKGTLGAAHVKVHKQGNKEKPLGRSYSQTFQRSESERSSQAKEEVKTKIDMKFDTIHAAKDSIVAVQKLEVDGDPNDNRFFDSPTQAQITLNGDGGEIDGIAGVDFVKKYHE